MKKEIIELEDLPSISVKEFAGNLMIEQNSDEDKVMVLSSNGECKNND